MNFEILVIGCCRHGVHCSGEGGVHGGERRVPAADGQSHGVDAGRFRHVLQRSGDGGQHDFYVSRVEHEHPSGQLPDPQQLRQHVVPGNGGGARHRCELGSQRHRVLPAAEQPHSH